MVEHLTETTPSASSMSRVFHTREAEFAAWKVQPLAAHYAYLFADGTYFYRASRQQADQLLAAFYEKYAPLYPTAMDCLKRDLDACLTFYAFPPMHWKTTRTTNALERLFGEVKRRSHKMAAAFRNETSCLLMFFAVIRSLRFNKLTMPTK